MKYLVKLKQLMFIILGIFLLCYLLRNQSFDVMLTLHSIKIHWLILLLGLSLIVYVIAGITFSFFIRAYIPDSPIRQSIQIVFLSLLVENLTIGAAGKATQLVLTRRIVSNWEQSICCIGFDFLNFQLVTLCFSLLPFFDIFLRSTFPFEFTPASIGLLADFIPITVVALLLYIPGIAKPISAFERFICTRFHAQSAKKCHQVFHTMKTQRHILENPKRMILVIFTNYLRLIIHYSLPIFALLALQIPLSPMQVLHIFLAEILVELMISIVPITGKHGIAESVFLLVFTPLLPNGSAVAVMLLWRLSTYYIPTIFAIIVFILSPDIKWNMLRKTRKS